MCTRRTLFARTFHRRASAALAIAAAVAGLRNVATAATLGLNHGNDTFVLVIGPVLDAHGMNARSLPEPLHPHLRAALDLECEVDLNCASVELLAAAPLRDGATFVATQDIGHFRMMRDPTIVNQVIDFITGDD